MGWRHNQFFSRLNGFLDMRNVFKNLPDMHFQENREILQRERLASKNFYNLLASGHASTFSQLGAVRVSDVRLFRDRMYNHLYFRALGWNKVAVDAVGSIIGAAGKRMIED